MIPDPPPSARPRQSRLWPWALFGAPKQLVCYLVIIDVVAVAALVLVVAHGSSSPGALGRVVLLLALAVVFEELSRKASRMRLVLSEHLKPDMNSVWSVAAAIALPPEYAMPCVVVLLTYMWFRHQRPLRQQLYLKIGTASTVLLACLAAEYTVTLLPHHLASLPGGVGELAAVVVALIGFTVINRGLVTISFLIRQVRGRDLIGGFDDNMVELATLCLGGLTAVAVTHQPFMSILVLLPMALLQRGALVRQLEVAATTDARTGLLNAVAWEELAKRDLSRAQRDAEPLAVLIMDLDRFKLVNDVHGHLTGDLALKAIGSALTHELRGYDTVGRFGGEEFVAALPNVSEAAALSIAERVRARINQIRISDLVALDDLTTDHLLAVSVGVACSPQDGADLTELLHAADAALYVAKLNGRNRVELARRGTGSTPETVTAG